MKRISLFLLIGFIATSCYKFDFNKNNKDIGPLPPSDALGIVSFTLDTLFHNSKTLGDMNEKNVVLDIKAVNILPDADDNLLMMRAGNGLLGDEYKEIVISLRDTANGFIAGKSYRGQLFYYQGAEQSLFSNQNVTLKVTDAILNGALDQEFVQITGVADIQLEERGVYAYETRFLQLTDFNIDVRELGGNVLRRYSDAAVFRVDGNPRGSNNYCLDGYNATSAFDYSSGSCCVYGKPTLDSFRLRFDDETANPEIKLLTVSILKAGNTGTGNQQRVGKYQLYDKSGYAELRVEAIGHNGKVYHEQQGKGYVEVLASEGWRVINQAYTIGFIEYEFAFELKSDDGEILEVTNGLASFNINR